jgi:hypothetical protein
LNMQRLANRIVDSRADLPMDGESSASPQAAQAHFRIT